MRHPHPRNHARGTNRPDTHSNLDRVGAGIDERLCSFARPDVPRNDFEVRVFALNLLDRLDHIAGMPVRCVHADDVNAGGAQGGYPLPAVGPDADRRADEKPSHRILRGVRVLDRFLNVFDGNQSLEAPLVVDHRELFNSVLVQNPGGFFQRDSRTAGYQLVAPRHHLANGPAVIALEPNVAVGQDPDQSPIPADRHSRNAMRAHDLEGMREGRVRIDGHRVRDQAAFALLDLGHLGRLLFDRKVAVDEAEATLLGHGDGHACFRNRVHCRTDQRNVQSNVTAEARFYVGLTRKDARLPGNQKDVVEGQSYRQVVQAYHVAL